jgi:hypothetical protein
METQTQLACQCLSKHKNIILTYLIISLIFDIYLLSANVKIIYDVNNDSQQIVNMTSGENKLQRLVNSVLQIVQHIESKINQNNQSTSEEKIFNLIWRKYYLKNNTIFSKTNQN